MSDEDKGPKGSEYVNLVPISEAIAHSIAKQISVEGRRGKTDPEEIARQGLQNQIEFIEKLGKEEGFADRATKTSKKDSRSPT